MKEMSREIENKTIIPSDFRVEKIARVVALVEYDNGTVVKVNPEEITFEDGKTKFEALAGRVEFSIRRRALNRIFKKNCSDI